MHLWNFEIEDITTVDVFLNTKWRMKVNGLKSKHLNEDSDMQVIVRAKKLCTYTLKVTGNMAKQYRYTLSLRLQNMSMEIIEFL